MRRSFHAITILTSALALVSSASLTGCKKKESAKPAAEQEASKSGEAADPKKDALARLRSQSLTSRLGLEVVKPEEIKPLIPALTGAAPIGELSTTGGGRRVTSIQCIEAGDVTKVKAELEAKLTELGFTSIRSTKVGVRDVLNVSAEKAPYRLSATVRSGPFPDCPAEQKKLKVLMSYFKRLPSRQPPSDDKAAPATGAKPAAPAGGAPASGAKP